MRRGGTDEERQLARRHARQPQATGKAEVPARSPLWLTVYLASPVAGLAVGGLINLAFRYEALARRFWEGVTVDPATAPGADVVNLSCLIAALVLWIVVAAALRRGGRLSDALEREAWAFVPALPLLLLVALESYNLAPASGASSGQGASVLQGVSIFAVHAVVFMVAGFAAVNAWLFASAGRGGESGLEKRGRSGLTAALVAAGVYFAVFAVLGALQYYAMNISYTDTADWEQMLYNTLHGRFLMSSAFPHMFFGEHVQFVHLFLLPFYAAFPSLLTLMVIETLALASGAIPVYLLAAKRLDSRAGGVAFAAAYLLYPAMQYVNLELVYNTFRPEAFAIPALLWAIYCQDSGRMRGLAVAAFFALASKEEMALPVAMIGVLLLIRRRWAWGAALTAVGAAWFAVSVAWVIPHFRHGASHMTLYYQDFRATSVLGVAAEAALHPLHALAVMLQPVKVDYLLLLFVPLGLLPLLSWRMMLVMLPSLATALLASREPSFTIYYHYQIALVPPLVMGAVYGAGNVRSFIEKRIGAEGVARRKATAAVAALALVSSLAANVIFAKSPISLPFYNPAMQTYWRNLYVPGARARLFFSEVRPLVPADASVSATEFAATYFARRRDDFVFPDGVPEADYAVVDLRDRWLHSLTLAQKGTTVAETLARGDYERIFDRDGFEVYRRRPAADAPKP